MDLWQIAEESNKEEPAQKEHTILLMGDHRSGKSSLAHSSLLQSRDEVPKSTVGLEYMYARAPIGISSRRDLVHIYELGGGRMLSSLLSVAISPDILSSMLALVVLDLSTPSRVLDSLLFWFQVISNRVTELQASMNARQSQKFMKRVQKKWEKHPDFSKLTPFPIPVVVVGSKYDVFCNEESENRKWMARTLRYFCHKHGTSLIYWSGKESQLASVMRNLLAQFAFGETARKYEQKDHAEAILISSACDSFSSIGPPPKSDASDMDSAWQNVFKHAFPK